MEGGGVIDVIATEVTIRMRRKNHIRWSYAQFKTSPLALQFRFSPLSLATG